MTTEGVKRDALLALEKDEALRPCPFCGGAAYLEFTTVSCEHNYCGAVMRHPSDLQAIAAWNNRAALLRSLTKGAGE